MKRIIPDTISEEEFLKILRATKKPKLKTAFVLGFYQCLRVSEVINLKKEDVDTEKGFLHIKQAKGKKDRHIPIMKEVMYYLRYLPIKHTRQGLWKALRKVAKKTISKDIYFHTLRHSGASHYHNIRKIGIRYLQEFLGHSRLSTTQIYTHIHPQTLKNAFENTS